MAPEVLNEEEFNEKADVYSFGIVLWELASREKAFGDFRGKLHEFIAIVCDRNERPPLSKLPVHSPPLLITLITKCWSSDPNERPLFPEILMQLSDIILEVAISDPEGQKFWKKYFFNREKIPWQEFSQALYETLNLPLPIDEYPKEPPKSDEVLELRCLRAVLTRNSDKAEIDIQRFGEILGWFGPMDIPTNSDKNILHRIKFLLEAKFGDKQCIFHGDLSAIEAENRLSSQLEAGTFLVRFSSNSEHPTWFTISKVSEDEKIKKLLVKHIRVEHSPGSQWAIRSDRERTVLTSSDNLVTLLSQAQFLRLKRACPGSPYQYLFEGQATSGYEVDYVREDDSLINPLDKPADRPNNNYNSYKPDFRTETV